MDINFAAALDALRAAGNGQDPAFRIINAARVPTSYLWATFLPERLVNSYDVKAGAMKIVPTMAGLAGADSPYAPGGLIDVGKFLASTAKLANTVPLTEMFMRNLHQLLQANQADVNGDQAATYIVLNFINLLLVQAQLDRMEALRGELFTTGEIDWTFNGKNLKVTYGVPVGNILTSRTGNDRYGGTTSKFWTDYRAARALLKGQVRAVIAHPDTIDQIVSNDVNKIITTSDNFAGPVPIIKNVGTLATGPLIPSPDGRDRTTIIGYSKEGSILDPATPGETIGVPFCSTGRVVVLGNPPPQGFGVDLGAQEEGFEDTLPLGYTHIGPTVEAKGALGRWAKVYTPDDEDWQLVGKSACNGLPVLEAPTKVVIMRTDMA
jgi:hypothetical protein